MCRWKFVSYIYTHALYIIQFIHHGRSYFSYGKASVKQLHSNFLKEYIFADRNFRGFAFSAKVSINKWNVSVLMIFDLWHPWNFMSAYCKKIRGLFYAKLSGLNRERICMLIVRVILRNTFSKVCSKFFKFSSICAWISFSFSILALSIINCLRSKNSIQNVILPFLFWFISAWHCFYNGFFVRNTEFRVTKCVL